MRDVVQLREIARLSAEGLNLEGIRRILELENQVPALTRRVRELEAALADELLNPPGPPRLRRRSRGRRHLAARRNACQEVESTRRLATVPRQD